MVYYGIIYVCIDDVMGCVIYVCYVLINLQMNLWGFLFVDVDIDQIIMFFMSGDYVYVFYIVEGLSLFGLIVGFVVGDSGYEWIEVEEFEKYEGWLFCDLFVMQVFFQ